MGFKRAIEELRNGAKYWEENGNVKRAKELKAAANVLEIFEAQQWHDITKNKKDLPDPGERVIICVGYAFNGEGYLKDDGKWYRYCDFGPVDEFMICKVVGWQKMPKPMPKPEEKRQENSGND